MHTVLHQWTNTWCRQRIGSRIEPPHWEPQDPVNWSLGWKTVLVTFADPRSTVQISPGCCALAKVRPVPPDTACPTRFRIAPGWHLYSTAVCNRLTQIN